MKNITLYREDIAILMKKVADIDAQCIAENRDPNPKEVETKTDIFNRVRELKTIIESMEEQENIVGELEKPRTALTLPDNAKIETTDSRSKDKFNSFGEQMSAVMNAGSPGGMVDPRLRIQAATGLGSSVSSDGGFLVQQDFSTELLKEVFETGVLSSKCRRITISGNSNGIKIPGVDETSRASTRSGGIVAYWKDEAALKVATNPKFRMIELNLKKLIGLCYATDELLGDATALEGFIKQAFIAEFGFQIDDAIINGTGAGQPLGVLNSAALVSVAKEAGQAKETVIAQNVINMYSRLFATSRPNAVWLINQNIEPQLFTMSIAVGTGGIPIYMPAGGLSGQPYGTLLGRPVIAIEQAATLGTVGDILFGDFGNGYILAEKGGVQTDMSIHVQFLYDESVFRFVLRVDGQPVRASALIPYKGGAAYNQNHFIALATRE